MTCIRRNIFHLLAFPHLLLLLFYGVRMRCFLFGTKHGGGGFHLLCFGRYSAPTSPPFLYGSPLPLETSGTSLIEQVERYTQELIGTTTLSPRLHFTLLIVCRPPDWLPMPSWSPPRPPSLFSRRQPNSLVRGARDVQPEKKTRCNTRYLPECFRQLLLAQVSSAARRFWLWPAAGRRVHTVR